MAIIGNYFSPSLPKPIEVPFEYNSEGFSIKVPDDEYGNAIHHYSWSSVIELLSFTEKITIRFNTKDNKNSLFPFTIDLPAYNPLYLELRDHWQKNKTPLLYQFRKKPALIPLAVLTLIAVFVFFFYLVIFQSYHLFPRSFDNYLGKTAIPQFLNGRTICDGKENDHFKKLTSITATHMGLTNLQFVLIDDDTPNAISFPDGTIVFFTGILPYLENGSAFAGVVAHEAAHIEKRHGVRQLLRSMGFYFIFTALFQSGVEALQNLEQMSEVVATLFSLKYSQQFEKEADLIACGTLLTHNLSVNGMASFFEKIETYDPANKYNQLKTSKLSSKKKSAKTTDIASSTAMKVLLWGRKQIAKVVRFVANVFDTHPENETRMGYILEVEKSNPIVPNEKITRELDKLLTKQKSFL